MRGGVLVLNACGVAAGPEKVRVTWTLPPGSGVALTFCKVLAAMAGPATSRNDIASNAIHPRTDRMWPPLERRR